MTDTMNKSTRITLIIAALVAGLAWLGYDFILKRSENFDCGNGDLRRTIDLRDFTTRYWAYSVEFEASIAERGKLAAKLAPQLLRQLSDAMQQGRGFRQFVVAGYNACAVTKTQYADFGVKFQTLDSLARQIDTLAAQEASDKVQLGELVRQYITLSQALAGATR